MSSVASVSPAQPKVDKSELAVDQHRHHALEGRGAVAVHQAEVEAGELLGAVDHVDGRVGGAVGVAHDQRVGVQCRDDRLQVAGRHRLEEAADRLVVLVIRDRRRWCGNGLAGSRGELSGVRGVDVQRLGDLVERHTERVVEDERDALRRWQHVEHDEGGKARVLTAYDLGQRIGSIERS